MRGLAILWENLSIPKPLKKLGMLSIIWLSLAGCNVPETNVERCLVDLEHELCVCHTYEINKNYIGRIGQSYDMPYEHCNKMVGFTPHNWWELRAYLGRVQSRFQGQKELAPQSQDR